MPEPRPIDKAVIERGRWLRDELEKSDSHLSWALRELADHAEAGKNSILGFKYGAPTQPVDYLLGRYHGLQMFRDIIDDAIKAGGDEVIRFAENRDKRPADAGDGPQ